MMHEVIFFFGDRGIIKEMLLPEFEAVLDHVVGVTEFAGRKVRAAYVRVDNRLRPKAAVFFTIGFTGDGHADSQWNVPLQHLADQAGRGPDLGAGPIRLACRSQCSISWHERDLWDPPIKGRESFLVQIAEALSRNSLGLAALEEEDEPDEPPAARRGGRPASTESAGKAFHEKARLRAAELLKEQRLEMAMVRARHDDELSMLHRRYRDQMAKLGEKLKEAEMQLSEERQLNRNLKATVERQVEQYRGLREEVSGAAGRDQKNLESRVEAEVAARVQAATAELHEMLERREVELFYRDEQIGNLREEMAALNEDKTRLRNESAGAFLQRLVDAGVTFVAYMPGIGQFTLPLDKLNAFLDSPAEFAAAEHGLDGEHFKSWMAHYDRPVCNEDIGGRRCGMPIRRVDSPGRFVPGESDRCSEHGPSGKTLKRLMNQ